MKVMEITDIKGFLNEFKQNKDLLAMLIDAKNLENSLSKGEDIGDGMMMYADLKDDTGLWHIYYNLGIGTIHYYAEDSSMNRYYVVAEPHEEYISEIIETLGQGKVVISSDKATERLKETFNLDTTSRKSLADFKKFISENVFLKNLIFIEAGEKTAAELFPVYVRYKSKDFKDYNKTFSFLWKDTPFKNARTMFEAITQL